MRFAPCALPICPQRGEQPVDLARRRPRRRAGHARGRRQGAAALVVRERGRGQAALDQRALLGLRGVGLVDEEPIALEHVLLLGRAEVVAVEILLLQVGAAGVVVLLLGLLGLVVLDLDVVVVLGTLVGPRRRRRARG